jgi:molecular chaperone DnaK (HSP70)
MRLGIDFGTTRTIVAVADRGNYPVASFENNNGDFQEWVPSLIAIRGNERRYGFDAAAVTQDPEWTFYRSFKRFLSSASPNGTILGIPVFLLLREFFTSLRSALENRSNILIDEPLEAAIGVPANSNSNQRFLTMEGFRSGGFTVVGLLDEPAAAGIEYAHAYRSKDMTRRRENLLVYDLGGGTFDCSVIRLSDAGHSVLWSSGISKLGGDDFDSLLFEMAEAAGLADQDRLLELCRIAKERLNPNSRKILLTLGNREIAIPVDEFYNRSQSLIDRTMGVVESTVAKIAGEETISCVYVCGGASEFPPVARTLRTRFGRRVRKSAYAHAAAAIGLAIAADSRSDLRLERGFTRNFGVWREGEGGRAAYFDTLFAKGSSLPARQVRRYHPAHNIGHFRYLECDEIDATLRPTGDIAPWDEILFAFDPQFKQTANPASVQPMNPDASPLVEEVYDCDENGIIQVTVRNVNEDYECHYSLRRSGN